MISVGMGDKDLVYLVHALDKRGCEQRIQIRFKYNSLFKPDPCIQENIVVPKPQIIAAGTHSLAAPQRH